MLNPYYDQVKKLKMVLEGDYKEENYSAPKIREKKRKIREELLNMPTRDLAAEGLGIARKIDHSAQVSSHLQGGIKGTIRSGSRVEKIIDTMTGF